jgi:mono/diheme cytochrome c family protein
LKDSKTTLSVAVSVTQTTTGTSHTLLAWNDLGMHCMDGDYSVFSILPPYNNLHAQLVDSSNNKLITSGVTLTFEAMADAEGSVNSTSSSKTNFWQNAKALFGADLTEGTGLAGYATASFTPQTLKLDSTSNQFFAEGIPITPYDDAGVKNPYPMVKVIALDSLGKQLAQARVVLPVSDEMSCASCHGSNAGPAAKPAAGWVTGETGEREYKLNILRLHDEKSLSSTTYKNALATKGYNAAGLYTTAVNGKPILCAGCHASNALPGTGIAGIKPLTQALHGSHATVKDATTGVMLDSITNRSACYQCHPGSETKCLRGVMGTAVLTDGKAAIDCQGCHGTMSNVGSSTRTGWLDQPNCQACHHDGQRELAAVSSTGILKKWTDTRYATNANVPSTGFSLYRFSKGHGNLQCEACHGATHAEYPSSHANDNVLSMDIQGREGTIGECSSCHKSVPLTADKGPHGMHTIGSTWVKEHGDYAENSTTACAYCHGADYRGGILSTVKAARSFNADGKTVKYTVGQKVTCYDCHDGPKGD